MTEPLEPLEPARKKLLVPVTYKYKQSRVLYNGSPCWEIYQEVLWKGKLLIVPLYVVTAEIAAREACLRLQLQHTASKLERK